MVTIMINGKHIQREFQNMAMALAFAVNNGECRNAGKLEIVYAAKPEKKAGPHEGASAEAAPASTAGSRPPTVPGTTGTADGKKQ
jgi:hypothetical protein